ncbi:uncharacterized protein NDAI_0F02700 [Naumovozyma dairenensis CBS 421]|uniref:phosphoinositide 5-phosphatase n=1 Tax=Naumovozyma dairenensis (strain ATCC 10597 / BCRC 20456 / CBS 421 / NBRC 0211 / NRRL Y-12639) TaxID=1071378 RepID=G0WCS7_NAUDC|nr:hypothetical protein NDAI_0F02700 [Naumovozyma dairenensis CBS 421]CCD25588.1 hypothetical protein NDAI_0F02700 [Naumovozyma dairenensis CBS 421]
MIILLSVADNERKISLVSKSYALVFKSLNIPSKNDNNNNNNNNDGNIPYCSIELVTKASILNDRNYKRLLRHTIHGFIGLIEINNFIFIGLITGSSKLAQPIPNETINKILSVDFVCLNDSTWDFMELGALDYYDHSLSSSSSSSQIDKDIGDPQQRHPCHDLKKLLSNGSFYYSSNFDLTTTLQNRYLNNKTKGGIGDEDKDNDTNSNMNEAFMWNSFMMNEIMNYKNHLNVNHKKILNNEGFLTSVIRGFAKTFISYINHLKIALTIISKQSWKRAGTRFNSRGIDDDGNVSNFVETEFIMYSSQYCYSFTQIRGSIPIFWEQDTSLINNSRKIQITRSVDATQPIFDNHFIQLIEKYGPVHIINLLSKTKSNELKLSKAYKHHLINSNELRLDENVFLTEFNFHKETAQDGFSSVKRILPLINESILTNGYFSYDVKEDRIISKQVGVFRINCLDCLDRTNLIEQTISFANFKVFLTDFKLMNNNNNMRFIDDQDFAIKLNTLWADNGDQISQIYTGTNALKSSFSRKGKMSLAGALSDATKSVSRMYINNFSDKKTQQNIDLLLGRLPDQYPVQLFNPMNEFINSKLISMADNFTSFSSANILIGTFNVNGMSSNKSLDISNWLFPIGDKFKPDMVVLGFQEVIELTAGSILNADYTKSSFWETTVKDCLNQYVDDENEKYILLRVEQMSSLLILFFVKSDKINQIKKVEGSTKKTGFRGMTGNKGAVAIRFEYGNTSFCFVNVHLSAGVNNIEDRRNDYFSIMKNITFANSRKISNHSSIFWLGDLNYRITLSNEQVRKELYTENDGYIERLLEYDQLTKEINSNVIFQGFSEPTVQFRPTYKYDFGTNNYDSSEKARTPSWTDRIVYKGDNLSPLAYSASQLMISDHRPVYAAYRAKIEIVDEVSKANITEKLYLEYQRDHPDETIDFSDTEEDYDNDDDDGDDDRDLIHFEPGKYINPVAVAPKFDGNLTLPVDIEKTIAKTPPPLLPKRKIPAPPISRDSSSLSFRSVPLIPSRTPSSRVNSMNPPIPPPPRVQVKKDIDVSKNIATVENSKKEFKEEKEENIKRSIEEQTDTLIVSNKKSIEPSKLSFESVSIQRPPVPRKPKIFTSITDTLLVENDRKSSNSVGSKETLPPATDDLKTTNSINSSFKDTIELLSEDDDDDDSSSSIKKSFSPIEMTNVTSITSTNNQDKLKQSGNSNIQKKKKKPPAVPVEKESLENLPIHKWKPLSPKQK